MSQSKAQNQSSWVLKNIDIYENIPESEFCTIAPNAFEKDYSKGAQIYNPHEPAGNIYVVHRGEVILYHSRDGKRSVFDTLGPGSVFGCFDDKNMTPTHFAQTTKNTRLCVTPVDEFLKIIAKHPQAMLRLMRTMAMRIKDYEEKMRNNIETASERVYHELLRLKQKKQRSIVGRLMPIPLKATHEQIAELTNLNRVTVTRCMKKLKEEGLVSINKKTGAIEVHEALV